jgi:high affinity Mn2+ porin
VLGIGADRAGCARGVRLGAPIATMLAIAATAASAADVAPRLPLKAPASTSTDWNGVYVGAHLGYATGYSRWSATEANGASPAVAGSLDFFHAYDWFKGTGSYALGLQAGYSYMFPSRLVIGAEADITFPNLIAGTQVFSSPAVGLASYSEQAQYSGTVRGRIGYAPGHWLVYATGGFAWTYDQFTRSQLAGMLVGGTATPGDVESKFVVPRFGATVGAGVELALPANWTARLEYLYTDYGSRSVYFPLGAQRFDNGSLAVQSVRLGLNYRIGRDAINPDIFTKGPSALDLDWFVLHGQTTFIEQYTPRFRSPYVGQNSLYPNQGRETWDVTFYAGFKLWEGAELWINPEIDQGFGLSGTLGAAGFPSGAAFKIGTSVPYARIQRSFIRQTINLGGETEKVEADANQFAGSQKTDRVVITVGKFSVSDVFDTNKYSQNPRKDFMNWSLIDAAALDYAADAWGYTYGAAVEWYKGQWTLRGALFDAPVTPNNTDLDPRFGQFQWMAEIERRYDVWGRPGKIAVTGFLTRARLGRFEDAIQLALATGGPADITAVRRYTSRSGLAMNLEQQVSDDLGVFARAAIANGAIEPDAYTDVDRSLAAGLALNGKKWGRPDDTFGLAGMVNAISGVHQAFLNAGGLGILVGDGILPNPGLEKIVEMYYSFPIFSWRATFDYQFIANPGYNRDRGPVSVFGTRLRAQF